MNLVVAYKCWIIKQNSGAHHQPSVTASMKDLRGSHQEDTRGITLIAIGGDRRHVSNVLDLRDASVLH